MVRAIHILSVLLAVALVVGCGLKPRERRNEPNPEVVQAPEKTEENGLDIDVEISGKTTEAEPLPMDTEFLEWAVALDETPRPAGLGEPLEGTATFTLKNTLERLLTGQIVLEAPPSVSLVPGTTIGWRLRGGRTADIPARVMIHEGMPLGRVSMPMTITVLGQPYRSGRLDVVKWLDVRTIGPFRGGEGTGLTTVYPPEKKVDFDRGCTWEGAEFAWQRLPLEALHPDGMVDFEEIYGAQEGACAYAALNVYADGATGIVLAFACDSPSTVWLDGRQVLTTSQAIEQERLVEVTLQRGRNMLLIKCCAGEKGWAFILNVVGKQGELPPGVKFDITLRGSVEKGGAATSGETSPDE
jgi:hypothetical protein